MGAHSVCHARTPPAQGHYWSSVSHAVDQIESNHNVSHLRVKHVRASWVVSISVFATETRWHYRHETGSHRVGYQIEGRGSLLTRTHRRKTEAGLVTVVMVVAVVVVTWEIRSAPLR